jgi:protoporphyrinogen oxidase
LGLRGVADELRLAQGLRFRSVRFLNLALDLPSISNNTWIYVPEERYLFFRVQEPRNWSPYLAPEGKTSMILELACSRGDRLWHDPDDVVLSQCLPQLVDLGLLKPERTDAVLDCFSTYLTHAYPVYDLDYRRKIEAALRLCDSVENLVTLGRQGLFRYNNMDQSLKMAFLAARHWGDPELDSRVRAVANERDGFEDGLAQAADPTESDRREIQ